MKTVDELFSGGGQALIENLDDRQRNQPVLNITANSKEVTTGSVFVAIRGTTFDGHHFIPDAEKAGAVLIVGERSNAFPEKTPYVLVDNARKIISYLAGNFYDNPSHELDVVGVTGTSGKTTITYLLESILKKAGRKVGVLGTVNFRHAGKTQQATHTTPDPVGLQSVLFQMKKSGCDTVVMEVSSHALKQDRVAAVAFDGMVFTNLSEEHLDYHPDMEDYYESKAKLFTLSTKYSKMVGKSVTAAVNFDDFYGRKLMDLLEGPHRNVITELRNFGIAANANISGKDLSIDFSGINGTVGEYSIRSSLIGGFNAENILAAVALCDGLGIDRDAVEKGIEQVKQVPGRLERVRNSSKKLVLVDYAHKPDALEKVLTTLREMVVKAEGARLITVVGCGGDRDKRKRPRMGRIAAEKSDYVFFTSDNPRTEDPKEILKQIIGGVGKKLKNFRVQADRRAAIGEAIGLAKKGDVVLIAGKGHEDYQILADPESETGMKRIPFDDRAVALEFL